MVMKAPDESKGCPAYGCRTGGNYGFSVRLPSEIAMRYGEIAPEQALRCAMLTADHSMQIIDKWRANLRMVAQGKLS
jgi:hypothetical protein